MTTLLETILPATGEIDKLIPQALLAGETAHSFKERYLKNLIDVVSKNPRIYRAYGAWWFTIKKMVIEDAGFLGFGINSGAGEADVYRYKKDIHTLIAAWLYMEGRTESGAIYSSSHLLDVDPSVSDEGYEYFLVDSDMEDLILIGTRV